MTWRLAQSLGVLQHEVNLAYPDRPRQADGTIGDQRHQQEHSDHNPLPPHEGVVTAWDITTDDDFTDRLADALRIMGKARDGRVKYVIFKGRITSEQHGWTWAPYQGYSQHFDHIHLSVSDDPAQYDRIDPWHVFGPTPAPTPAPIPAPLEDTDMALLIKTKNNPKVWITNFIHRRWVQSNEELHALTTAGVPATIHTVTEAVMASIKEA